AGRLARSAPGDRAARLTFAQGARECDTGAGRAGLSSDHDDEEGPVIGKAISAAAGAAVALAIAATAGGNASTGPGTIRITDRETSYRLVQGGFPRPGVTEVARQTLFNARITNRSIGHADLLCTYLTTSARTCNTTYFLPKGKIVVAGAIGNRLIYQIAVVGGTGLDD